MRRYASVSWTMLLVGWVLGGDSPAQASSSSFIANRGQVDERVSYYATGTRAAVYFTADAVVLDLKEPAPVGEPDEERARRGCAVYVRMAGAHPSPTVEARGEAPARYNYFLGRDPAKWRTEVPAYEEVVYRDVWPGVDLVFREERGALVYEASVRPGADAGSLAFGYEGADGVRVEDGGIERVETSVGSLIHQRSGLSGRFRWEEPGQGARSDPGPEPMDNPGALLCSTFLGGSNGDAGGALAVDPSGNALVTGHTSSPDFPTTPGAYDTSYNGGYTDAFVAKISSSGDTLLWSTFLGGDYNDGGAALALDAAGNVLVTGSAGSSSFPTTPAAYDTSFNGGGDIFVAKISSSGTDLVWSTFLGGSLTDYGRALALDVSGNVVVAGWTGSPDFRTTLGAYETSDSGNSAFVAKLSSSGSDLLWSTYLGAGWNDDARSLALDALGNVVVTGDTGSPDFPTTPGAYDTSFNGIRDVFVVKLSASGSTLLWSTFLGGSQADYGYASALDASGNVVVTGYTSSSDFPTTPEAYDTSFNGGSYDILVAKLSSSGSTLLWSSFLGGNNGDLGYSLALDVSGDAVVTGLTSSSDFPTTWGAYDASFNGGGSDILVAKLSFSEGILLWSTFLGGSSGESGEALVLDASGSAVVTGLTSSLDFPTTPEAYDSSFSGGTYDAIVAKLDMNPTSRIWHINPAGTGDAPTIQAGIDSAAIGETVLAADGIYAGVGNRDLDFGGKNLVLRSENGPELTVIDCQAFGRGMNFHSGESPAAEVRGFTIKDGYVSGVPGGGIYVGNSSPTFANCIISGNRAPEGAGGFVGSGAAPAFSGCSILANETFPGGNGGGGIMADSSSASFTDCAITGNRTADAPGGGIHCRSSASPTFTRCRITENFAPAGGGVSVTLGSMPAFANCTVSGNQAGDQGGGLYANDSYSTWEKSILWGNFAPAGGEAWLEGSLDVISFWCSVVDSSRVAAGVGAEVYYEGSDLFSDPLFCRPACTCCADTSALFTLAVNSPCLPVSSLCGELIGSEGQECDSVLVWVGSGDGTSWGDPYNWNEGRIPQAGDHVQITRGVGDHVRLMQAATIAELTLCGRGLVTDTLEIASNGHLEVPKIRTTEEILLTEGEALGGGGGRFMVPGQLVVQPDTLRNLPGGEVALEVGSIGGSGGFVNYGGGRFAKRGIGAGEVGLYFRNGGRGAGGDTAVVEVLAGTLAVSDSLVNEATLTVEAGALLEVQDRLRNLGSGAFNLRGLLTGTGVVENYGLFQKAGLDTSQVSVTFRNRRHQDEGWVGEAQVLEGTLVVQGLLENGAKLTVEPGAILDVANRVSNLRSGVLALRGTSSGSGAIDNRGLFQKPGPGLSSVTADLNNILDEGGGARGRIEVDKDTLAVATLDNNGVVSVTAGAVLAVSDSFTNRVNATVEGGGTLDVSGALVTNEGIVSPGRSAGILHFVGDFNESPSAEINMEIGGTTPGTEYDVLSITGSAILSGALHVDYVGGFTPSPGDTFTLIQISEASQGPREDAREDGFQCFSGLQLPGGLFMDPVQLLDAFLLVAIDSISSNNPPAAEPDTGSVAPATHIVLHLVRNDADPDADPLTIATLSTEMTAGEVFLNVGDTTVTYVPPFLFAGWDSFAYVVTDCKGASDSAVVAIEIGDVTDVPPDRAPPAMRRPLYNYPNPFNPLTTIRYVVAADGLVRLSVYDVRGRLVRTLVNGRQAAGFYAVLWDGTDGRGEPVASGIYFLRLTAGEKDETRRMVLVR